MKFQPIARTNRLLIASLVALPMALASSAAVAGSCPGGSCGVNEVQALVTMAEGSMSTVQSASLEAAYERIETVAAAAEEKNIGGQRAVRESLGALVGVLQERSEQEFETAMASYFEGNHASALAMLQSLSELDGLPAARAATRELEKEDDRAQWRAARDLASEHIDNGRYAQALDPINEINRLYRRTDYVDQTRDLMQSYSDQMIEDVQAAQAMVEQGRYDSAYATLIEISRLSPARQSSAAARRALGAVDMMPEMRQARGEYDAMRMLTTAQAWYGELTHPAVDEHTQYRQQLDQVLARFPGTRAAEQAQQLLSSHSDQQASR